MKKRLLIIVSIMVAFCLAFAGCASRSASEDSMNASAPQAVYEKSTVSTEMAEDAGFGGMDSVAYDDERAVKTEESSATGGAGIEDFSEKIIYNVHTSLLVEDVEVASNSITEKVKSLGGYISYANTYNSNGYNYANIEVRVPSKNLSQMEEFTYEIGKVEEYTMSTDNITESYYDIQIRLDSAIKEEAQLIEVLGKAETIEEILLVREQLGYVQERIESYKGKIRLWDSLVDYSTITYNIKPVPTLDTDSDDSPRIIKLDETWRAMKRGFNNSVIWVANFFSLLLRVLAVLAIPLVICGVIVVVIVVLVKSVKKRKKEKDVKEEKE